MRLEFKDKIIINNITLYYINKMLDENKIDSNYIIKAFENNPISILKDDNKKILFKALDIAKAIGIKNIAQNIQNYDEDERVLCKAYDTTNREQDTTFLTSQGVYRLLYNSKKEIAKQFRKWAGNILDDIIFNESTELKKQLKKQEQLLLQQKEQSIKNTEDLLIKTFHLKCIVYLIQITATLFKFGFTDDINRRLKEHKKEIGENITLIYCIESKNNILLEQKLKDYLKTTKNRKSQIFNNKKQTELIEINDIYIIKNKLEKLNKPINENLEILKTQEHILELKLELEKLKIERLDDKYKQKAHILLDQEEQELLLEEELLNKENEEIELLPENTIEELEIKKLKLENNKTYYEKNKEKILQFKKEYRENNKEKIKENEKKYKEKNKEKINKQKKK